MKLLCNLFAVGVSVFVLTGCGDQLITSEKKAGTITTETVETIHYCDDGINIIPNCPSDDIEEGITTTTTTTVSNNFGYSSPVTGSGLPSHYTFLTTPMANLCVDAFNRSGVSLPDETVAKTFNSFNYRSNGVALQDMAMSATPVMNIITLDSVYSDVMFQFLNPMGYYCIVNNHARFSNVTLQRSCSAFMVEVEPATHIDINKTCNYNHTLKKYVCDSSAFDDPSSTSISSNIVETPCIP